MRLSPNVLDQCLKQAQAYAGFVFKMHQSDQRPAFESLTDFVSHVALKKQGHFKPRA